MSTGSVPRPPVVTYVDDDADVVRGLEKVLVDSGRPVVVLIGGANGMDDTAVQQLHDVLRDAVIPIVRRFGAAVVDGGTDSGVMRAMGRARSEAGESFPLIGVAARGTVQLASLMPLAGRAPVEPHHTHLLLVPGSDWGDEAAWLAEVATLLAGKRASVTLLANGGEIAFDDVERSLERGRSVVVLAGTGRTADTIAEAASGHGDDPRARRAVRTGRVRIVAIDSPDDVSGVLADALHNDDESPVNPNALE